MRTRSLQISDIVIRHPVTARADESVQTCARRMHDSHVGSLIVVEDRDNQIVPVGMLTDRDITIEVVAFGLDPATLTAGDVMASQPTTVYENDDVLDALARMRERAVRRLPVVDTRGYLVGLLSIDNILEAVGEQFDGVNRVLRIQRTKESRTRPSSLGPDL